jgi:hypothetical protein
VQLSAAIILAEDLLEDQYPHMHQARLCSLNHPVRAKHLTYPAYALECNGKSLGRGRMPRYIQGPISISPDPSQDMPGLDIPWWHPHTYTIRCTLDMGSMLENKAMAAKGSLLHTRLSHRSPCVFCLHPSSGYPLALDTPIALGAPLALGTH